MRGDFTFHLVHVAGSRMIAQGTDGISRGCLSEGVMSGATMLSFVPLHLSALDRHPDMLPWIRSWSGQPKLCPLTPEDWYLRGQGFGGKHLPDKTWTTI